MGTGAKPQSRPTDPPLLFSNARVASPAWCHPPSWASGLLLGWVRLSNQTPSPEGTPEGFACAAGRVGAAMPRGRLLITGEGQLGSRCALRAQLPLAGRVSPCTHWALPRPTRGFASGLQQGFTLHPPKGLRPSGHPFTMLRIVAAYFTSPSHPLHFPFPRNFATT